MLCSPTTKYFFYCVNISKIVPSPRGIITYLGITTLLQCAICGVGKAQVLLWPHLPLKSVVSGEYITALGRTAGGPKTCCSQVISLRLL